MPFQPDEIGRRYDFGVATVDGTTIAVKNKDGNPVNVSSVAFVTTNDETQKQAESTNLTRLQRLVQMSSPNMLDRQFDDWPQVSQGDFTGGIGQKVYGANNTANQYWDGQGLIWPLSETVPVAPIDLGGPSFNVGNHGSAGAQAAGYLAAPGEGYAVYTRDVIGATYQVAFYGANGIWSLNSATFANVKEMVVAAGAIWLVIGTTNDVAVYYMLPIAGNTFSLTKLADIDTRTGCSYLLGTLAVAMLGNHIYVAAATTVYTANTETQSSTVWIYTVDTQAVVAPYYVNTTSVSLPFGNGEVVTAVAFQGPNAYIAVTDGQITQLIQYTLANPTYTQVGGFNANGALLCAVGSANLFVIALNNTTGIGLGQAGLWALDLWILQSGSLTHVGPLNPYISDQPNPPSTLVNAVTIPSAWGSYALFEVIIGRVGLVYAYDVLRNALFKAAQLSFGVNHSVGLSNRLPVIGAGVRTVNGLTCNGQWAIVISEGYASGIFTTTQVHELWFGVTPGTGSGSTFIQPGMEAYSGIIDFTSSTPKNFRSVHASFMPQQAGCSIEINAWLDQDPAHINSAAPQYSVVLNASDPTGLTATDLWLPVNAQARKLIYEVSITGPANQQSGGAWVNCAQLLSVEIEAAVGWVQEVVLDLSPTALTNTLNQQEYVFQNQGLDHVAAYNFLRQLYRTRGGYFVATLANGDSYRAKIQNCRFESPKPFGAGMRSDQQASYQSTATIEFREDV